MKTIVVTPKPYIKVDTEVGLRRFFIIQSKVWEIAEELDETQELYSNVVSEACDYEGDLDKVTIYNCELSEELIKKVCAHFGIEIPPENHDLVFTP